MESQPQNPEVKNNPENFHPWQYSEYTLTLFRPIEFSIKLHTIKSGWSIVYIEGSPIIISPNYYISFSEDRFCLSKQCRR